MASYLSYIIGTRINSTVMIIKRLFSDMKMTVPTRYNTITQDKTAFISYHPKLITSYSNTQPIGPDRPWLYYRNKTLSEQDMSFAEELRNSDPFVWSINVLASLFNVPKQVICESVPLSNENKELVIKESELKKRMTYYQRKKFIERNNEKRKTSLKKKMENINYNFPGKLPELYNDY